MLQRMRRTRENCCLAWRKMTWRFSRSRSKRIPTAETFVLMLQLKSAWEPLLLLLLLISLPLLFLHSRLSSLSLLRPRAALHDRGAKNSIRNPPINSEKGGGKREGDVSAHKVINPSLPAPPSMTPVLFMICHSSLSIFLSADRRRFYFYLVLISL